MWNLPHLKRADGLCKNIPHNGVKLAPLGGRSVPKLPIYFLWCRTAHEMGRPTPWKPLFQLNITLDHSVIETRGQAHLTQTTNQHLRIIVKLSSHAPSNHLEHLSNTSHRLPLKEIKGISQDRSVIETWGWARLSRGSKQPILNHLNTHCPRPSQPLSSTLATKIHRGISSFLNVTEAWELVYIIHTDKKPLEYRDC